MKRFFNGMFHEEITSGWILSGEEREKALRNELKLSSRMKMDSEVECLHCGDKFLYKDAVAIMPYHSFIDGPMIMCKNYPECSGNFTDLWDINDEEHMVHIDDMDMSCFTKEELEELDREFEEELEQQEIRKVRKLRGDSKRLELSYSIIPC